MSIEKKVVGSEKAGNELRLELDHTLILWKARNIIHIYLVNMYDSEGDLVKNIDQKRVTLLDSEFDKWVTQEMEDASMATIDYGYNESIKNHGNP